VELCNLDYRPDRGSAIDAHKDDAWSVSRLGGAVTLFSLLRDKSLTVGCPLVGLLQALG
jgi:hypothetical protein